MRRTADRLYQALRRMRASDLPENAPGYAQLITRAEKLVRYHDSMVKALDRVADRADEMQAASCAAAISSADAIRSASVRAGETASRLG